MTQLSALSWKEMTLLVLVWVGTGLESNALAHADKLQMLQIHTRENLDFKLHRKGKSLFRGWLHNSVYLC